MSVPIFDVPIVNAKNSQLAKFHPNSTSTKDLQYDANMLFSILFSELHDPEESVVEQDITEHIKELLVCQPNGYADKISFTNNTMIKKEIIEGKQFCHYKLIK